MAFMSTSVRFADELDATVRRRVGMRWIFQVFLAHAERPERFLFYTIGADEVLDDRVRALLRQLLIVLRAASRVGVSLDDDLARIELAFARGEHLAQVFELRFRFGRQIGRAGLELH